MKKYDDHVDVEEPSSTPTKISMLISRQRMSPEIDPQPKPQTPPPDDHNTTTMISVPFKWEESPGKPRHCHTQSELSNGNSNSNSRTTLELPPRLLFLEANKVAPSPTTRLYLDDGPLLGRAMSFTTSYRTPRENWNSNFGSSRWTGFRKINQEEEEEKDGDEDEGSVVFSNHCNAKSKKAKVKKITKGGSSFSLLSNKAKSHLWASIYESFKQVVPWRRRKETQGKWPSKTHTV